MTVLRRDWHLENAPDDDAVLDHVIVVVAPLPGWARERSAFEDQRYRHRLDSAGNLKQRLGGPASQFPSQIPQGATAPKLRFKSVDLPGDAVDSAHDRFIQHRFVFTVFKLHAVGVAP
jgi:hypothetical protein